MSGTGDCLHRFQRWYSMTELFVVWRDEDSEDSHHGDQCCDFASGGSGEHVGMALGEAREDDCDIAKDIKGLDDIVVVRVYGMQPLTGHINKNLPPTGQSAKVRS
jgi:hypothetical protein